MRSPWAAELWRFAGVITIAFIVGILTGAILLSLFAGTLLYLVWHLYNLYRLEKWLEVGPSKAPPDVMGAWGFVYSHLYRLQQRNRKRKRKLTAMLKRFQESTAAMPDATVVLRGGDEIDWFNDAASRLLGLTAADLGQRIGNLMRHPRFIEYLDEGTFDDEVVVPSPIAEDNQISVRIIPYSKKKQRLLVARDISQLHRLETIRRDFVANASHELRTPLTVIGGFLETLMAEDHACAEHWQRPLRQMHEQSSRMEHIVSDLLLLSKLESGDKPARCEEVSVPVLIAAIHEDALSLSGETGHRLEAEVAPNLWLRGSASELRSAFSNIVFNAVQYTPAGRDIYMRWYGDENGAYFEVEDKGEGIAQQHLPRLTERFYRVDVGRSRASGGTGLGLAIVKHVLQRHGGRLQIESEPGKGSLFRCRFPANIVLVQEEHQASG